MKYISTRGDGAPVDFVTAMMTGLAPDGGLYVPDVFSKLPPIKKGASYIDTAEAVLGVFTGGHFGGRLRPILERTYGVRPGGFYLPEVTPLKRLDDRLSVLELFHGPTLAFKDVALQLLGQLFSEVLSQDERTMTILGATSGDTGSAAIEGCRHAKGAQVFILYPHNRPSDVQRRQMTTVNAENVHTLAIEGNFDDCQAIVKTLFSDVRFNKSAGLTAVNSINWARVAAQVVYYVQTAYSFDEPVTFVVPTGNFGNVYAGYVAKKMGAPIRDLVVASNRNDILARFLETGSMEKRTVAPSLSPSMDIQVSSNFERLLFDVLNRDSSALKTALSNFTKSGSFAVPPDAHKTILSIFKGARCDDAQTLQTIARIQADFGYLIDPHTATGFYAYEQLKDQLTGPVVALACAHPAKFPDSVEKATGIHSALPPQLADLYTRPERFTVLPADADAVRGFIESHS